MCCNAQSAINYSRKYIFWCAATPRVLYIRIENQNQYSLLFWCAATRRVLEITIENQSSGVLQLAECCKLLENQYSGVLQLASAVIYNRKSILWCAATRRVLSITIENQYSGVLHLAECWKLKLKTNILVCCNSPSAVNYHRKPICWCAATRRVLYIRIESQYFGVLQLAECSKLQ